MSRLVKRARLPRSRDGDPQGSSVREAPGDAGFALVTLRSLNSSELHLGHLRSESRIVNSASASELICDPAAETPSGLSA